MYAIEHKMKSMITNNLEKVSYPEKEYQRCLQVTGHQIDDIPNLKYGLYCINIYNVFKSKINNIKKDCSKKTFRI